MHPQLEFDGDVRRCWWAKSSKCRPWQVSLLLRLDLTGREHDGCGLDFISVNAALTRKPFFSLHRKRKPHLIGRILMMRRGSGICLDMGLGAEGLA
jgi:hypothetical protein